VLTTSNPVPVKQMLHLCITAIWSPCYAYMASTLNCATNSTVSSPRSKSSPACADNSPLPLILLASDFLQQLRTDYQVQSANQQEGQQIMERKIIVIALAVFAFGFGSAMRSNAGTEVIEPYRAPAPRHNYAPPPPPPHP